MSRAKPTASSSKAAPALQAPVLQPTYTVAAVATRQIPTVAPLSSLNRAHIDTFKLAIESLRRASDQTPREVFITEAVSNLLTLKLFTSRKIKKQKEKYWHEWDDRTFFEVLQEIFPSDKHRGENDYQTAMACFNDVRLDVDFNVANSELRYAEKIQRILHEIGGEENFSRS